MKNTVKHAILCSGILAIGFVLSACGSTVPTETTTTTMTTTTKTYNYSGSGSSYNTTKHYTQTPTYKQDDPYYKSNDYNKDGRLSQDEFQGAVNDYMDDYFNAKGSGSGSGYDSGKYGYGSDYDNKVYKAADAFGEDPDHVNDVYQALADAMY